MPTAPDWLATEMLPRSGQPLPSWCSGAEVKLATKPDVSDMTPMQLGPIIRISWLAARCSERRECARTDRILRQSELLEFTITYSCSTDSYYWGS